MNQLTCVCRQSRLSLSTKLRLYNALVVSVLLYGAETWTLIKSDEQKLEAFQMSRLRRILGLHWFDFVSNDSVMNQTQQQSICSRIRNRRITIFGHVCEVNTGKYVMAMATSIHLQSNSKPISTFHQLNNPSSSPISKCTFIHYISHIF